LGKNGEGDKQGRTLFYKEGGRTCSRRRQEKELIGIINKRKQHRRRRKIDIAGSLFLPAR